MFVHILCSLISSALMPIPSRYPGLMYGVDDPLVHLEVYVDPLCPICGMFWPTFEQIVSAYPTQLKATIHMLPLPYHTWAYTYTRSIIAVGYSSKDLAKKFMKDIFTDNLLKYSDKATKGKSEDEVLEQITEYVVSKLGIDKSTFLNYYNIADSDARIEFKFAASHGVNGTPVCYLNGVETDLGAGTPLSTWQSVIDGLIGSE